MVLSENPTGCLETYREQETAAQSCDVKIRYIRFYSARFQWNVFQKSQKQPQANIKPLLCNLVSLVSPSPWSLSNAISKTRLKKRWKHGVAPSDQPIGSETLSSLLVLRKYLEFIPREPVSLRNAPACLEKFRYNQALSRESVGSVVRGRWLEAAVWAARWRSLVIWSPGETLDFPLTLFCSLRGQQAAAACRRLSFSYRGCEVMFQEIKEVLSASFSDKIKPSHESQGLAFLTRFKINLFLLLPKSNQSSVCNQQTCDFSH